MAVKTMSDFRAFLNRELEAERDLEKLREAQRTLPFSDKLWEAISAEIAAREKVQQESGCYVAFKAWDQAQRANDYWAERDEDASDDGLSGLGPLARRIIGV